MFKYNRLFIVWILLVFLSFLSGFLYTYKYIEGYQYGPALLESTHIDTKINFLILKLYNDKQNEVIKKIFSVKMIGSIELLSALFEMESDMLSKRLKRDVCRQIYYMTNNKFDEDDETEIQLYEKLKQLQKLCKRDLL